MALTRTHVIQALLNTIASPTYLEIGVADGENFRSIRARRKWGVDPGFGFNYKRESLRNLPLRLFQGKTERYFPVLSDDFFKNNADLLAKQPIHVAFVDGAHTYAQSLTDVINCIKFLAPGGIIVMHDCNPTSEAMAYPAPSLEEVRRVQPKGFNGDWCGDVWKAVVHLKKYSENLDVFVLDADCGLGIVRPTGKALVRKSQLDSEISAMDFRHLVKHSPKLTDLRNEATLQTLLHSMSPTKKAA